MKTLEMTEEFNIVRMYVIHSTTTIIIIIIIIIIILTYLLHVAVSFLRS
jgi:hypothetical protein